MGHKFTESDVEDAALEWLSELGCQVLHGPEIAPGEPASERADFGAVVLEARLRRALAKLNPEIPASALDDAAKKVLRFEHAALIENNRRFHKLLIEGVEVEYQKNGRAVSDFARLADFERPDGNEWLAVNQFTVIEDGRDRRPDVVLFLNGLPLAVIELKNAADEKATTRSAFKQLQTYKAEIPSLLSYNAVLIASDGVGARAGTVSSDWERFMPWRTADGQTPAAPTEPQLEVLIKGMLAPRRFLELVSRFVVFEEVRRGAAPVKKLAAYHQYFAVQKAVDSTVQALKGDRRVGIVWHTQGSGKSLTMAFYAGQIIRHPAMTNPTLVVLTDRNDLDDQLFGTFSGCRDLLRQKPVQAQSRQDLQERLNAASGGVIFTTIQKFLPAEKGGTYPTLSERRNIVVIADEAHRSQYDFMDGFAKHMRDALPNASFIGFTATPIEKSDRSTRAVFGEVIDVYDIHRSIEDKATVPIYYEARLARLGLKPGERPRIDPDFEEITEGEEDAVRRKLKSKWARLEGLVGAQKRVDLIAKDIVGHFEERQDVMDGKGLVVCMSRRICVELHDAIVRLRPGWRHKDDERGFLKVVMTGSAADGPAWQEHIRDKKRRHDIGETFKNPASPIKLVIVRDMWLTGFDVPSLHTLYLDKPMRGHGLMQAIARVNRVFKNKPGGLVVDYLGVAHDLKKALAEYSAQDRGDTGIPQETAVAVMQEKLEILRGMMHGLDCSKFFNGSPAERLRVIPNAMQHVLAQKDGKTRFLKTVMELSHAFALSVPAEKALAAREEIGFFQALRAQFVKNTIADGQDPEDLDSAVRQIVSRAVSSGEVLDVFGAAGLKKPDISILSDAFLEEVRGMPQKNLALELLKKLLSDSIKLRSRKFLVESRTFSQMLEEALRKYHSRGIEAAQIIEALIRLAKDMREAQKRGERLNLSDDELAFYDALETNDSAVKVLGDETLRGIARDLVDAVHNNVSIDWTLKESVRAKLRTLVKRILRRHGYPPDKQEKAVRTVLEQAEIIGKDWAA
ncbi:MAG TPA: type I restriction endonuclease subunit R [Elusimicrobiota bacterium]|nr:type I restriction endonuclease subunit R [Elusimicrobiota bacterium]